MNVERYPEYILRYLRMRCGMDEADTSRDDYFQSLDHNSVFSEVLQWKGLLGGWDVSIKGWILDIYGVDLDDIRR